MDLSQLTPDQLRSLKTQLEALPAGIDGTGRSPFRPRQLHDLRLLPTKDDPRPTFFWSAESPRDGVDVSRTTPYPALMWHRESGEEITVFSAEDEANHAHAYTTKAPQIVAKAPMDELSDLLAQLPEADRALVLEAQRQERMQSLKAKLAALTPEQLEALLGRAEKPAAKKKAG